MKNGWKLWLGLGAGLAAGVAAGFFLNSDRGRQMRRDTTRRLDNMTKEIDEMVRHEVEDLSTKANEAIAKTKAYAEKAKTTLREKFEHFSQS